MKKLITALFLMAGVVSAPAYADGEQFLILGGVGVAVGAPAAGAAMLAIGAFQYFSGPSEEELKIETAKRIDKVYGKAGNVPIPTSINANDVPPAVLALAAENAAACAMDFASHGKTVNRSTWRADPFNPAPRIDKDYQNPITPEIWDRKQSQGWAYFVTDTSTCGQVAIIYNPQMNAIMWGRSHGKSWGGQFENASINDVLGRPQDAGMGYMNRRDIEKLIEKHGKSKLD